ncbi:hypothetical protein HDZ31DRAFT_59992 [Schizophyllum fasciatum]
MHILTAPSSQETLIIIQDARDREPIPSLPSYYDQLASGAQEPTDVPPDDEAQATPTSEYPLLIQQYALLCSNSLPTILDADLDDLIADELADSLCTAFTLYEAILRYWFPTLRVSRHLSMPFHGPTLDLAVTRRPCSACAMTHDQYFTPRSSPLSGREGGSHPKGDVVALVKLFEPDTFASDIVRAESLALTRDAHAAIAPYLPSANGSTLVICAFGRRWRASLMSTLLSGDVRDIMPDDDDTGWMDDIVGEASHDVLGRLVRELGVMQCSACRDHANSTRG